MRLIVLPGREKCFVGGDKRQLMAIGEIDGRRLDGAVITGDTLQFDIKPVAEQRLQGQQPGFGELACDQT